MVVACKKSLDIIKNLASKNDSQLILTNCIDSIYWYEDIDVLILDMNLVHKDMCCCIWYAKKQNSNMFVYASDDKLKLIKKATVFDF